MLACRVRALAACANPLDGTQSSWYFSNRRPSMCAAMASEPIDSSASACWTCASNAGVRRISPGRAYLYGFPLDVRVGIRLLVKHKWLTVVGSVAIAFAVGIGVSAFEFFTQLVRPTLPLERCSHA